MNIFKSFCSYKFTFHYGPIQIELYSSAENAVAIFTFHYGPIQIY